jgi:hypothetical protein
VNLVAILWVAFITIILSIPDGMRAGKAIAGLTVLLGVWWILVERHRFRGPAWTAGKNSQLGIQNSRLRSA